MPATSHDYSKSLPGLTEEQRLTMSDRDKSSFHRMHLKGLQQWIKAEKKKAKGLPELVDTGLTLDNLLAIEGHIPRATKLPKSLYIHEIHVAQKVFQFRIPGTDPLESERHIKSLTAAINDESKGIDLKMTPIMVTMVGDTAFLVDGHHRLTAYMRSKWQKKIRVDYYPHGVIKARAFSLIANVPGKLGLNTASRSEAAWQLVQEDNHSKAEISKLAGRSESLVAHMRRLLSANDALRGLPWAEAICGQNRSSAPDGRDDRFNKMADTLAKRLIKNMGSKFPYSPGLLAAALRRVDPELPQKLCLVWSGEVRLIAKHMGTPGFNDLDI